MNSIKPSNYHSYSDLLNDPKLKAKQIRSLEGQAEWLIGTAVAVGSVAAVILIITTSLGLHLKATAAGLVSIPSSVCIPAFAIGVAISALGYYKLHKKRTDAEITNTLKNNFSERIDQIPLQNVKKN